MRYVRDCNVNHRYHPLDFACLEGVFFEHSDGNLILHMGEETEDGLDLDKVLFYRNIKGISYISYSLEITILDALVVV